jgi:anti-anti-sigma factor
MQYTITLEGDTARVAMTGPLTFSDAPRFPDILAALAKATARRLAFDLNDVDFIDSTGMSLFVHVYDACRNDGRTVVLGGARGMVLTALEQTGFKELFDFR